jgi:CRISPR-associated protein Cmr4
MNTQILGLLAETSVHPGAGQSSGIVDLPVAREAATDYPVIPGSSLKGALRDLARAQNRSDIERIFGKSDNAGALLVSDARLLLLPVRSLQSAYKWATCPHLLERFARDQHRAGLSQAGVSFLPADGQPAADRYLGRDNGPLFLEERQFGCQGGLPDGLVKQVKQLIPHERTRTRLTDQVVILHDDDFAWFARYGLAIQARNVLSEETKMSENLWYEETIPADALFYTLLAERAANAIAPVKVLFNDRPYLQVGGNETVGMGWFAVAFPNEKEGAK